MCGYSVAGIDGEMTGMICGVLKKIAVGPTGMDGLIERDASGAGTADIRSMAVAERILSIREFAHGGANNQSD